MSVAQTRYARGAAAPNPSATVPGITKIDEAIVRLMMLAVSSRVPIARTSCVSGPPSPVIIFPGYVHRRATGNQFPSRQHDTP